MNLVCLDTHILVWGILGKANPAQREMVDRAGRFLRSLDKSDSRIIVPALVVAELLVKVPVEKHADVLRVLRRRFVLAPFDAAAASLAAMMANANGGLVKKEGVRETIKTDCQIAAVAVAQHASVIYSEDSHLETLGKGFIEVQKLPSIAEQGSLFPQNNG